MFDEFAIDTADLTVFHDDDVRGLFEPVSAIVFLNVDDTQFEAWRAAVRHEAPSAPWTAHLTETFWHEAYHCFQTYSTGYLYEHHVELFRVWDRMFPSAFWPAMVPQFGRSVVDQAARVASVWMTPHARMTLDQARRFRSLLRRYERLERHSKRSGHRSIAGALMPDLYPALERIRAPANVRGRDGVSARDVVEGAAFTYGREQAGASGSGVDPDGPYQRLIRVADEVYPDCSARLLRAAAALALRYEQPGMAFRPLLDRLAGTPPGSEPDAARTIAAALPALPEAGRVLGTAADARRRRAGDMPRTYDDQIDSLESGAWGIDELDLLIDADGPSWIPGGELGFAIVTLDGKRGFSDQTMGPRLVIGTTMLPTGPSLDRLRRNLIRVVQ